MKRSKIIIDTFNRIIKSKSSGLDLYFYKKYKTTPFDLRIDYEYINGLFEKYIKINKEKYYNYTPLGIQEDYDYYFKYIMILINFDDEKILKYRCITSDLENDKNVEEYVKAYKLYIRQKKYNRVYEKK